MKQLLSFVLLLLFFQNSQSQTRESYSFGFTAEKMENVLLEVETKFKIKYSYVDSLISHKKITLPKKRYSLSEINQQIADQTALIVNKIDNRFYAISSTKTIDTLKKYYLNEIIVEGFLANGINKTNQKFTILPQKVQTVM